MATASIGELRVPSYLFHATPGVIPGRKSSNFLLKTQTDVAAKTSTGGLFHVFTTLLLKAALLRWGPHTFRGGFFKEGLLFQFRHKCPDKIEPQVFKQLSVDNGSLHDRQSRPWWRGRCRISDETGTIVAVVLSYNQDIPVDSVLTCETRNYMLQFHMILSNPRNTFLLRRPGNLMRSPT